MEKVSNEVGKIMLIMNDQVYAADDHFFGYSYWIKSVDVEYAASPEK